ncbi:hypothetical protein BGZ83_007961 [Gryganskiella cystojenkinii]|nr:hypothetical protein BGZ83_007961 [Gryganskiella cystojenkinii]
MVNKAPKPQKPSSKDKKAARRAAVNSPFESFWQPSDSLLKLRDEIGGKELPEPFLEMFIFVIILFVFFLWRLRNAIQIQHAGAESVWSLLLFGSFALVNFWSLLLVMVMAKKRGDMGLMKISDREVYRFLGLSGILGTWGGVFLYRYKSEDPYFYPKLIAATVFNIFWVAIYVKYNTV